MLKGNRYTVSERMGEYPPMDTPKPFRMPKELKEAQKKALVDMMADDANDGLYDPDAHTTDTDEYLRAKQGRAEWLKGIDPDKYTNQFKDEQEEADRGDDQEEQEPEAPVRGDL